MYVSYLRVSTKKQAKAKQKPDEAEVIEIGLGLQAQRDAVADYLRSRGVIEKPVEFLEVESGKSHKNRPKLQEALALCKRQKGTLIVGKLDRLARNVHFISGLMESKVDFVAVDFPEANRLTLHILAAVAEHEREMISTRTKAALAAAKRRGKQLGVHSHKGTEADYKARLAAARTAKNPNQPPSGQIEMILRWRDQDGLSLRAIGRKLAEANIRTPRSPKYPDGCEWKPQTLANLIRRARAAARAVAA